MTEDEITAGLTLAEEAGKRAEHAAFRSDVQSHIRSSEDVPALANAVKALADEVKRYRNLILCAESGLSWARGFIEKATGEDMARLQGTEARMAEVFGPHDGKLLR